MKIELIDENQIRCTLTREDLTRRNMRLYELAYGTEKARALFQDMMQQAAMKFGFEPGDSPLMIEAVPVNPECLVLVITKVEDPDELDSRFSNFSPALDITTPPYDHDMQEEDEEDFFHVFSQIKDAAFADPQAQALPLPESSVSRHRGRSRMIGSDFRVYAFSSLQTVTAVSKLVAGFYNGHNTLYSEASGNRYFLKVYPKQGEEEQFLTACAHFREYARNLQEEFPDTDSLLSYLRSHCEIVLRDEAIQKLSQI